MNFFTKCDEVSLFYKIKCFLSVHNDGEHHRLALGFGVKELGKIVA